MSIARSFDNGSGKDKFDRGPKDHINTMISHTGSKAKFKRDTRSHGL